MYARLLSRRSYLVVLCTCAGAMMAVQAYGQETSDAIRKFNPRNRTFVAIDPAEVVPGQIYNHYSPSRGRYVWAYATQGGGFSYPLGPGSTELPANFASTASPEETERLVQERAAGGDSRRQWDEGGAKVRLNEEDKWDILPTATSICRSHFDLDTQRRWEWHGNRRVAVRHMNGYQWRYADGRYLPINPWLPMFNACGGCDSCW